MKAGHDGEGRPETPSEQRAFRRFLDWLDEGLDSRGQKYLEVHRRLVSYFDRKNCLHPREFADETLSRVARRLDEEGSITGTSPTQYCYIVARFVFLEEQRRQVPLPIVADEIVSPTKDDHANRERMIHCLEQCLSQLEPDQRELILGYYQGEQGIKIALRRKLAAQLGLSMNALSIRACRIRDKLETCIKTCSGTKEPDADSEFRLI